MLFLSRYLNKLYDDVIKLADRKNAMYWLCFISFIESFFFPIPPYVLMVPMIFADKSRAWKIAFWAMVFSILGGFVGYYIGKFLFDIIAIPIFEMNGYMHLFNSFEAYYHKYGMMIIFVGGLTPMPYKLIAIMSGAFSLDIWTFGIGSLIVRGIRFYLVSWVLYKFGVPMNAFLKQHIFALCMGIVLLIVFSILFVIYA